jgi:phenylpropionate dioxygenase-like ring-hydroxylating dioxygenase large terminal subunit
MLEGFWYIASEARRIKVGQPLTATLLDHPIVLFRDPSRTVHALEDRCAHRGVPLSAGWQEGNSIRCRYHGWRFSFCGECIEIPAQGEGPVPKSSSVRSFPVHEQDGWIWLYMGTDRCPKPATPPPMFPVPADGSPISVMRISLPVKARMDLAVDNFIDAAHVPFVHHGLFRQRHVPKLKEKEYTRLPQGFRTTATNIRLPNTIVFRVLNPTLAPAKTTVDFLMPGIHTETFEVGSRWGAIMVVVTPLTDKTTRLDFTMGWNFLRGWFPLVWLARLIAGKALRQDRDIIELQERGFAQKTTMNLSLDSDQLAVWYRRLQKYHLDQQAGRPNLVHPVPERTTLRWVT